MSDRDDGDRTPISWESLAAELAATREEAEERGDADPETWDAVAAELAARVTDRPAAPLLVVVPAEEEPAVPALGGLLAGGGELGGQRLPGDRRPLAVGTLAAHRYSPSTSTRGSSSADGAVQRTCSSPSGVSCSKVTRCCR